MKTHQNKEDLKNQIFLAEFYKLFLSHPLDLIGKGKELEEKRLIATEIENNWNKKEVKMLGELPIFNTPKEFMKWYRKQLLTLNREISGFINYITHQASLTDLAYYICMEELVDGSFDDIMAMIQLGLDTRGKMCIAKNYWDEMGNGSYEDIHTSMFKKSASYMKGILEENGIYLPKNPPIECLMNGNSLLMWAHRRDYIFRIFGAAGLVEGSAPIRFNATTKALERLNLPFDVIRYHKEHIEIDSRHSEDLIKNLIEPYALSTDLVLSEIAKGVLIRFRISKNYYNFLEESMRTGLKVNLFITKSIQGKMAYSCNSRP